MRRKAIVLSSGQENIVLQLNITPFFSGSWNDLMDLSLLCVDGHHIYPIEKHGIHTVEEVQSGSGLGHEVWSRTKSPIVEGR